MFVVSGHQDHDLQWNKSNHTHYATVRLKLHDISAECISWTDVPVTTNTETASFTTIRYINQLFTYLCTRRAQTKTDAVLVHVSTKNTLPANEYQTLSKCCCRSAYNVGTENYPPSSAVLTCLRGVPPLPRTLEGRYWRCSTSCRPTVCTRNSRMFSPLRHQASTDSHNVQNIGQH